MFDQYKDLWQIALFVMAFLYAYNISWCFIKKLTKKFTGYLKKRKYKRKDRRWK